MINSILHYTVVKIVLARRKITHFRVCGESRDSLTGINNSEPALRAPSVCPCDTLQSEKAKFTALVKEILYSVFQRNPLHPSCASDYPGQGLEDVFLFR